MFVRSSFAIVLLIMTGLNSGPGGEKTNMNKLTDEQSPYLLQHAHNPVNWYPWGEEAFEKAAKEDKPVFLSLEWTHDWKSRAGGERSQ